MDTITLTFDDYVKPDHEIVVGIFYAWLYDKYGVAKVAIDYDADIAQIPECLHFPSKIEFEGRDYFVKLIGNKKTPQKVREVYVPEGVLILDDSFNGFYCLEKIHLPSTLESIESYSFHECDSLSSIDIPTSVERIGFGAFSNSGITKINIPRSVKVFSECMFHTCKKLEEVVFEGDLEVLKSRTFMDCESLVRVKLPENLISFEGECFRGCSSLEKIIIPGRVKKLSRFLFYNCQCLTEVIFPEKINYFGESCFEGCKSLKHIEIPSGVLEIGMRAFKDTAIESLYIPEDVEQLGYGITNGCNQLTSIVVSPDNLSFTSGDNYNAVFDRNMTVLITGCKTTTIPPTVKTIYHFAFSCLDFETIELPEGVESLGMFLFSECPKLKEISLPDTAHQVSESCFYKCENLNKVRLPLVMDSIKRALFEGCRSLKEVIMPESCQYMEEGAFRGCESLYNIQLPKNLYELGREAFAGCESLTKVELPEGLQSIGPGAFLNCINLEEAVVPPSVGNLYKNTFKGCKKLKK